MLISDIRDEIISEIGQDTSDTDFQTKMLKYMKSALRRFPRFARNRMLVSTKSGSLSAAASTMSLPDTIVSVRKCWYQTTDNRRVEITRPGTDTFTEEYRGNGSGAPNYFIVRQDTVEFDRPADQAYTIYFESFIEIDDVAAGDTWAHSNDRAEILKDGAKMNYYVQDAEDMEKGSFYADLFAKNLKLLEAEYLREEFPDYVEES